MGAGGDLGSAITSFSSAGVALDHELAAEENDVVFVLDRAGLELLTSATVANTCLKSDLNGDGERRQDAHQERP